MSCSQLGLMHFVNDYTNDSHIIRAHPTQRKNRYGLNFLTHENIVYETKLRIIDILQVCCDFCRIFPRPSCDLKN